MNRRFTKSDLAAIGTRLAADQPLDGLELSKPKKRNNEESIAQQNLIKWWAVACKGYKLPEVALIAIPLQGNRTAKNGARMKKEGLRKGTWDLQLLAPRGKYHALWIEMKAKGGKLTPEQKTFGTHLVARQYEIAICFSMDEAVKAIVEYLSL